VSEDLKKQNRVADILKEEGLESDRKFFEESLATLDQWLPRVYLDYPSGLSWQAVDALGRVFCSEDRVSGYVLYFLNNKIAQEGHTCYPLSLLFGALSYTFPRLVEDKPQLQESIRKLMDFGRVMVNKHAIWITHSHADENMILSGIRDAASRKPDLDIPADAYISGLTSAQAQAIRELNNSRVLILDGFPGTGKTWTSSKIVKYLEAEGYDVTLLAPTGLAAKNLKDRCKKYASTIHSFVLSRKNQDKTLQGRQAFIIDEFSMVDTRILSEFFEVIQDCSPYLVFVGDTNQLPSVGAGNLLAEIISLKDKLKLSYVQLTEIIRQQTGSEIAQNAALIRSGRTDLINQAEFNFCEMAPSDIPQTILKFANKMMSDRREFVVLSPVKKGPCGVDALNAVLREIFNPPSSHKRQTDEYREGDRILVNRNFYDYGLVNGDIGTLKEIQSPNKFVIAVADKEYTIDNEVISNLKHAYALTVHKAQGQEFETVLMPFIDGFGSMLKNRLLYTAITRAKRKCVVFGNMTAMKRAIKNNKDQDRFTGLQLIELGKPSWGKA
jgi:exodeoxyribonuclease V alpha subunit